MVPSQSVLTPEENLLVKLKVPTAGNSRSGFFKVGEREIGPTFRYHDAGIRSGNADDNIAAVSGWP